MEKLNFVGHFNAVKTTREHNGYIHSVGRTLTIVILGTLCGLTDLSQIQQWAKSRHVREFLKENFGIYSIPSYSWIYTLMSIISPESLNELFTKWTITLLPAFLDGLTMAFDGKTICSTGKMGEYENPLHILSAHLAELGLTISRKTVDVKSNEIPAMQELLNLIDIRGCMVVADALNCQTKTAEAIINNGGDYLLSVKGNQETLMEDIEDFVQDDELRAEMDTDYTREKNGGRIEFRRAFVSGDIDWMDVHLKNWLGLSCFGAINRRFTIDGITTNEWHYYISSRNLSAKELLEYARKEWSVESMHRLLDVHFNEDSCRLRDRNSNENMNIVRKIALNCLRTYKNNNNCNLPLSKLMLSCLCDCEEIIKFINWK